VLFRSFSSCISNSSVATKELEIQLEKLIIEPLQQVLEIPVRPIVIIIDGLDECKGEDVQSHVARLLGSVFQRSHVGGLAHICFVVASRPEPWIRDVFDKEPLSRITRQHFLGQTSEANDDIWTFFRLGFTEIHDSPRHESTMSNVPKPWPSYRVLDDLVAKASGQFIYPATVLKFVDDPNYRPTDRLSIITSIPLMASSASTTKPLAALDQLYSQILSTSVDKKRTQNILGALIAMEAAQDEHGFEWPFHVESLRIAEKLLGLQPGDGPLGLRTIHSLVHVAGQVLVSEIPDDDLSLPEPEDLEIYFRKEDLIRFHHKSFVDYLVDPTRSLEYCVDIPQMHKRLALACLDTMQFFSLQPHSRIACSTFSFRTIYCSISHITYSILGLCNTSLGWSRHRIRTPPARVIASLEEL